MAEKIKIRKERYYKPHAEFVHAADVHLQHFDEGIPGHFYSLLSTLLTSAFALEAYLNLVGAQIEPGWKDFERASMRVKLRHICTLTGLAVDFGREPFQTVQALFSVRNALAHARPEQVVQEFEVPADVFGDEFSTEPRPKHFNFVTVANAKQSLARVRELIKMINQNLPDPDPFPLSLGGWSGGTL